MGNASHLAALMLLFGAATADAQTPVTTTGSYQQLSAGNQKIARALFEAQVHPTTTTTTSATTGATKTATPKPLTLDQIAGLKQSGSGWDHVFKQMQRQGLIADKSLGQVVSRYNNANRAAPAPSASPAVVAASSRPQTTNVMRRPAEREGDGSVESPVMQGSGAYTK